jgi:hypothetical protein
VSTIESRTIDGRIFLAADDVTKALRDRADDFTDQAEREDPSKDDAFVNAVAYHAVAQELRQRADWIDLAVLEHIS